MPLRPPTSTLFPYTTLFRSPRSVIALMTLAGGEEPPVSISTRLSKATRCSAGVDQHRQHRRRDRKSTRLNSSHVSISYAVFCLKKKKKKNQEHTQAINHNKH